MAPVRDSLRGRFFDTLRRALRTDDGREMVVEALSGLTAGRPRMAPPPPPPYPDLASPPGPTRRGDGAVFITARFRTGSTLLWNIFRHVPDRVAYYEPLNERRWFDPAARGERIDQTHRGVDDYWREYDGLADLSRWYRDDWVDRGLCLDEHAWQPGLRAYFDRLIEHAAPARAVLQCNRIDFRLPWIRAQFPGATIVHLYRHPRDQWCSSLVTPADVSRDVTMADFEAHDHYYLRRWARDLQRHLPFLAVDPDTPPYRLFYLIWRLSHAAGVSYADYSVSFEALTQRPLEVIRELVDATGDSQADVASLAGLISSPRTGGWHRHADDDWFRAHEIASEQILQEFFQRAPGD